MRVISKSREVPYCDCFYIEEEWYVASMPNGHNSCCFKVSFIIVFVKSTMMQSIIKSNTVSEQTNFWNGWNSIMKSYNFVQVDKPIAAPVVGKDD